MAVPTPVVPRPAEREVVVFLHSLGTDRHLWRPQVIALGRHYRVLTPESRGHGSARWHRRIDLDAWVADLDDCLERALGPDPAPVHLVGLSMGGVQAIEYAARRPGRVKDLVLADTFAALPPDKAHARVEAITREVTALGMAAYADRYLQETLVTKLTPAHYELLHSAIAGMLPEAYIASAEATFLTDHLPLLPDIPHPTLVLVGENDHKSPAPLSEQLSLGIPNARLKIIPEAGHLSSIENSAAFNDALTAFYAASTIEVTS